MSNFLDLHARRRFLAMSAAIAAVPKCAFSQEAGDYAVSSLIIRNFPIATLATCNDLRLTIQKFESEIKRLNADFTGVGAEIFQRMQAEKKNLQNAIERAEENKKNAKIDAAFAQVNLALSLVFVGIGCALVAPVAIGIVAGTSVLAGTASFAFQAYAKSGSAAPSFVLGYGRDRAIMFTELAAANAGSSAGKLLASTMSAAALLIGSYEVYSANTDAKSAAQALENCIVSLKAIDQRLTQFGANKAMWANVYQKHLQAARDSLLDYVKSTEKNNCLIRLPGPIIHKP